MSGFGYDLDAPQLVGELRDELKEISGLGIVPGRPNELVAIQDESGKVYRLDARDGRVISVIPFWKDGDYEGVETIGNEIWVVKSTGTLYRITNAGQPSQQVEKYNGHLTGDNDVEGLAYDAKKNRLLLACKADADDDGNPKNARYIFAFDLQTKTLSEEPVFALSREAVTNFLSNCPKTSKHEKLCEFFTEREEYDLAPSALAIHPLTGQLFITSSVGKVLMVVSAGGQIEYLFKLEKDFFPQPEGLTFADDGTLYISTEARNGEPARIYKLTYAK